MADQGKHFAHSYLDPKYGFLLENLESAFEQFVAIKESLAIKEESQATISLG